MSKEQGNYEFGIFTGKRILTTCTIQAWSVKQAIERMQKMLGDDARFKLLKHPVSVQTIGYGSRRQVCNWDDAWARNQNKKQDRYLRKLFMREFGRELIAA